MPWRPARLRGARVLARCDESGTWIDQGGRVEIRYKPQDGRAYRAAANNLEPTGEPILPDDHCGAAEAAGPKAKGQKGAGGGKGRAGEAPGPVPEGAIVAYTDGACSGNPGPAGLGVVLTDGGERRELSEFLGRATNNIAELTAILRALERVGESERPFVVHTDSQYSIGVLTKGWKPKVNQALILSIKQAMKPFQDLRFVYVRGHAGIPLNERADTLARSAVEAEATQGWEEVRCS